MRCKLYKQINHSKMRQQFRKTFIHCPLVEREDSGMMSLGVLCGGCCVRFSQLIDFKKDLLLRQVITVEDCKRNPDVIEEHLPEQLKQYYSALKKIDKTLDEVESECSRCKPTVIEDRPVYSADATEITQCGRNDLR